MNFGILTFDWTSTKNAAPLAFIFQPSHHNFFGCASQPGLPDGIFSNQKIPIWVNFGGAWNGKGWYFQWSFGIYDGPLVI
jgi:hypothetical protein